MGLIAVIRRLGPLTSLVAMGILSPFLVSSLSVVMAADVGMRESRVGIAIAVNFLTAMACSMPAGRFSQARGSGPGLALGAAGTALGLLSVALSRSFAMVLLGMAFAGASMALLQVSANQRIVLLVPPDRLGFAFSLKQSAIPVATLLAGMSVPVVARLLPWRAAFFSAAVLVGVIWFSQRRVEGRSKEIPSGGRQSPPRAALVLLALGIGAASAAATSTAAFLVPFLVGAGFEPRQAGSALATGSLVTIFGRLLAGQACDRWNLDGLRMVVAQVGFGATALLAIAWWTEGVAALGAFVFLAFAAGWTWSGVFTDAVVRSAPKSAATSTGVTQMGIYFGGGVGPLLFGLAAEYQSYAVAWRLAGALFVLSAVLVSRGRTLLLAYAGRPSFASPTLDMNVNEGRP